MLRELGLATGVAGGTFGSYGVSLGLANSAQNALRPYKPTEAPRSMRAAITEREEQAAFYRRAADAADSDVARLRAEDAALTEEYGPEASG